MENDNQCQNGGYVEGVNKNMGKIWTSESNEYKMNEEIKAKTCFLIAINEKGSNNERSHLKKYMVFM